MKLILFIFILLLSAQGIAQSALFAEVDKDVVAVNEQFTYTLTSTKNCQIAPPRFRGLQILGGPIQGSYHSSQVVNGKKSSSTTYTFTWYLRAKEMGIYTIEKAEMECKKKTYESSEIKMKIASQEEISKLREGVADHYLTLESNKTEVFEGEPFILSLKFYSKKRPSDVENYVNGGSSGLQRQDLRKPMDVYKIIQQDIKGNRYYVIELRREMCIPLRAGEIEIEPSYGSMWYDQGIFDSYRLDGYSNGLIIHAIQLPLDSPNNYIGLVGDFSMDFEMDKVELKENQSLEMKMTLSGTGNFDSFDPPQINLPDGLELYSPDPEIEDTILVTEAGLSGSRVYTYTVLAKEKGDYTIQPFNFSYFDVYDKNFDSLSSGELEIIIHRGSKNIVEIPGKEPIAVDTTDIRYINTASSEFYRQDDFFYGSFTYYLSVTGPISLAILTVLFIRRRSNLSEMGKLAAIQKGAKKSSLRVLNQAKSHLGQGDEKLALQSLQSSLFGFFTSKLNLALSDLSKVNITSSLREKNIEETVVSKFEQCWTKIEMAQYSPIDADNINLMISDTEDMINSLHAKI